tara:strand:- start:1235 stop:1492 length:258 start_codon:yes stop_codon:yes gene_type:complete
MVFRRNRKFYAELRMEEEGRWVCDNPLFTCGDKGLYPVFKTGGPTGRFPKNHQEFILKNIGGENGSDKEGEGANNERNANRFRRM